MRHDDAGGGRRGSSVDGNRKRAAGGTGDDEAPVVFRLISAGDDHLIVVVIAMAKDADGGRGKVAGDADDARSSIAPFATAPIAFAGVGEGIHRFTEGSLEFERLGGIGEA